MDTELATHCRGAGALCSSIGFWVGLPRVLARLGGRFFVSVSPLDVVVEARRRDDSPHPVPDRGLESLFMPSSSALSGLARMRPRPS